MGHGIVKKKTPKFILPLENKNTELFRYFNVLIMFKIFKNHEVSICIRPCCFFFSLL